MLAFDILFILGYLTLSHMSQAIMLIVLTVVETYTLTVL